MNPEIEYELKEFVTLLKRTGRWVDGLQEPMRQSILVEMANAENPEQAWNRVLELRLCDQFFTRLDSMFSEPEGREISNA